MNKEIKKDFEWFNFNPKMTYLDSSATSLKPRQVIQAEMDYYNKLCCNPHNNDSVFAHKTSLLIEESREIVAKLINASKDEIVFTSGATESLNLIANGLEEMINEDDEIILTYIEHSSNLLPWQNIANKKNAKIVWVGEINKIPTEADIIRAISTKTKVISFCDISNIIAHHIEMNSLSKKAKGINPNIIISVDATQSIPHIKHDVASSSVDFMAFASHKMLGPTGVGVAYINNKWIEKISPLKFGGGMNTIIRTQSFDYSCGPSKFEGGTPNCAGILGFAAAIKYLNNIGWDKIEKHEKELKEYINKRFSEINNLVFYSNDSKFPVVFFNIKGCSSQDLANYLGANNIIVRSGLSCAKLSYNVISTEAAVRASFYVYNTKEDVNKLVDVLKKYKKGSELDNVL